MQEAEAKKKREDEADALRRLHRPTVKPDGMALHYPLILRAALFPFTSLRIMCPFRPLIMRSLMLIAGGVLCSCGFDWSSMHHYNLHVEVRCAPAYHGWFP